MQIFIAIIAFIVIFSVLVLIHELGHFYVAKRAGIKIEEFGFGLPPRIWGKRKGETLYSLNAIPFGGFVRLLGEDAHNPKMMKDKRSFVAQPARIRIMVVIAGVVMNFLLAWILLTAGFIFGIQPLILSADDVFKNIESGTIEIQDGVVIKEVSVQSKAEKIGMLPGDTLKVVEGKEIVTSVQLQQFAKDYGFIPHEVIFLPRVVIQKVKEFGVADRVGIQAGDILLALNKKPVYHLQDLESLFLQEHASIDLTLLRGEEILEVPLNYAQSNRVVIANVYPATPAEQVGFKRGDILERIDEEIMETSEEVAAYTREHKNVELTYYVYRNDEHIQLKVRPQENGTIGVGLGQILAFENNELSFYLAELPVSITKIHNVRYPLWSAPVKALEESWRLSVLTVQMFGNVIHSLVTKLVVPEGVAGPIGIAQLTYVFVQEGVMSLVRFMALLSLSLAIINILPFPALDGGRLFFILAEVVVGKKVSAKFEAVIHSIGFFVLMVLIVAVTYSDIIRLIFK